MSNNPLIDALESAEVVTPAPIAEPIAEEERERQSQASALVMFIKERCELFHDQNQEVYAKDLATYETRRVESRAFKDWLVSGFFEQTQKSARDQSVREAISTLSGLGRFMGECREVSIRVAAHSAGYYLDLGQKGNSRAVRIYPGGWECTDNPPVCFVRPETLRPIPEPIRGANLDTLWDIANIPESSRLLVIAWLCECLRPDTPFPVLELIGEQGSAKSTTQTALRRLIDPNACDLRAIPKTVEDMYVSALVNWLASYENVSHLPPLMQDALCIIATGGGHAKRKLYTDAEETVLNVKRPIILNGISAAVTAQDLIDRAISVEMPIISERFETTGLWHLFDERHSAMLGALLGLMAGALARLPTIMLPKEEQPRLIEFVRFGMAITEALGKNGSEFLAQFTVSRQDSIGRTIDASPVASAVLEWFEHHPLGRTDTAKALMESVAAHKSAQSDAWPRSPKGFADALRRAAPALRQFGIECRSLPKTGGIINWEIRPREKSPKPCPECPVSPDDDLTEQDIRTCRTSVEQLSSAAPSPGRMVEVVL